MSLDDQVEVETAGGQLVSVRIGARWRELGSPTDLEQALSAAIRSSFEGDAPTTLDEPSPDARRDLSVEDLADYWELHRQWRDAMTALKRDIAEGKYTADVQSEVVDEKERVSITFAGGRFEAVHFNPRWIADASLQAISDALSDVFSGLDLQAPSKRDAAVAHVKELSLAAGRFAS